MEDAAVQESSGLCSAAVGDCGTWLAPLYFMAFTIIGSFVLLNLLVAVILENFSSLSSLNPSLVSAADIDLFKDIWAELDPDADQLIPSRDLITVPAYS